MENCKKHICPICHKELENDKYIPFCSKRCADVDLGRWFNQNYSFISESEEDDNIQEELYDNEK